jgi:anti-sigma factor RsiW
MNCPLETREGAEVLLDFCGGGLSPAAAASVERHLEACPACRQLVQEQRAVVAVLDSWTPAPVSRDFDRRLYQRIEHRPSWHETLAGWFRPLTAYRGVPAAVAACLLITAGVLIERPAKTPVKPEAVVEVQAEQVEAALDTIDTLSEFSRKAKVEASESKL